MSPEQKLTSLSRASHVEIRTITILDMLNGVVRLTPTYSGMTPRTPPDRARIRPIHGAENEADAV